MENKNKNSFITAGNFVFFALEIKERVPGVSQSAKEKAVLFIEKLAGSSENASIVVSKLNPFLKNTIDHFNSLDLSALHFDEAIRDERNLSITLKLRDGSDVLIQGEPYLGLFWGEILKNLKTYSEFSSLSSSLIKIAIENDFSSAREAVESIARGEVLSSEQRENALIDFDSARPLLNPQAYAKRQAMKRQAQKKRDVPSTEGAESSDLDLDIPPLKSEEARIMDAEKRLKSLSVSIENSSVFEKRAGEAVVNLPLMEMSTNISKNKVDVSDWQLNTIQGLARTYSDVERMGLPVHDSLYRNAFAVLKDALDPAKNPYKSRAETADWFNDPFSNLDKIASLSKDFDGKAYVASFNLLLAIRSRAVQIEMSSEQRHEGLSSRATLPGLETAQDVLSENVDKIKKAVKEKDWFTVGAYALGGYLVYKASKLAMEGTDERYKRWGTYALGLGAAGFIFLPEQTKKFFKWTGFMDENYEVKGTSTEYLKRILDGAPKHAKEDLKDINYPLLARMSNTPLSALMKEFGEAHKNGRNFISPHEFPSAFGEFTGMNFFNADIEEGLSPQQRAFRDTGRELYNIALAMRVAYNETLFKSHPDYKGVDLEKALQDPTRKLTTIGQFFDALAPYTTPEVTSWTTDDRMLNTVRENLRKSFEGLNVDFSVTGMPSRSTERIADFRADRFYGTLMGYPVRFVLDSNKNTYRIYYVEKYLGDDVPGADYFAEIPVDGGDIAASKGAVNKMGEHIKNKITPLLEVNDNEITSPPVYEQSKWKYKYKNAYAQNFGLPAKEYTGSINFNQEGVPYFEKVEGFNATLFDYIIKKNPEFSPLVPLLKKKILELEFHKTEPEVYILVSDKRYTLKYNSGRDKFEWQNDDEANLLSSMDFQENYVRARLDDPLVLESLKKLETFINESSGALWTDVKKSFSTLFNDWEIWKGLSEGAGALEGQVPNNYANLVMKRKWDYVKFAFWGKMKEAKSFAQLENIEKEFLVPVLQDLNTFADSLRGMDSSTWGQGEFISLLSSFEKTGMSGVYYDALRAVQNDAISKFGDVSDLAFRVSHDEVYDYVNIFIFYTAHLDGNDLDTAVSPFTGEIKLRDAYLRYVKDELNTMYNSSSKPAHPSGASIEPFDIWRQKQTESDLKPLHDENNKPPLSNERQNNFEFTELEKAYIQEHAKVFIILKELFRNNLFPSDVSGESSMLESFFNDLWAWNQGENITNTKIFGHCRGVAEHTSNRYQQTVELKRLAFLHALEALRNDTIWKDIAWNERVAKFYQSDYSAY